MCFVLLLTSIADQLFACMLCLFCHCAHLKTLLQSVLLQSKAADLLELSEAHSRYLATVQHVCLLSDSAKELRMIVEPIMQSALELVSITRYPTCMMQTLDCLTHCFATPACTCRASATTPTYRPAVSQQPRQSRL